MHLNKAFLMYAAFSKKQTFCSHLFISDFIHKDLRTLINYLIPSLLWRKRNFRTANLFSANFFCGVIPYLLVHLTTQFLKKKKKCFLSTSWACRTLMPQITGFEFQADCSPTAWIWTSYLIVTRCSFLSCKNGNNTWEICLWESNKVIKVLTT